jgi:DNA-directed RNA polymerase subunit M/transcription elongation factor TFIIS
MSSIDSIAYPDQFRIEVKKRILALLHASHGGGGLSAAAAAAADEPATATGTETIDAISTNIEKGIFNWTIQHASKNNIVKKWSNPFFVTLYIDHLRSVYINLKKPDVSSALISGNLKSQEIAFMTHQDICPDKWKKLIEDKKVRDKQKYEPNIEASTDNFTCNKCKSKKCTYYQLQTRSADEPMTTFVTCLECGKRWKC